MSADGTSFKYASAGNLAKIFVLGAVYIAFVFLVIYTNGKPLTFQALDHVVEGISDYLMHQLYSQRIIMIAFGLLIASFLTGTLVLDLVRKLSIITLLLLFVMTVVDAIPAKLLLEKNEIYSETPALK